MRTKTRRGAQASQAFFSQRDEELHKFDELAEKTIVGGQENTLVLGHAGVKVGLDDVPEAGGCRAQPANNLVLLARSRPPP